MDDVWPSRKPPVTTESPSSGGFQVLQDMEPELEQNSAGFAQAPSTDDVTNDHTIPPELHPYMAPDVTRASPHLSSEDRVVNKPLNNEGKRPRSRDRRF